jgi:hypothetical protein
MNSVGLLSALIGVSSFFLFLNCQSTPEIPSGLTPGWQHSSDMYEVKDYTWTDITSTGQLTGRWYGSKIIQKPAVANLNPAYALLVKLEMIHVDSSSRLYSITEDQYFTEAVSKGANWDNFKASLAGTKTGNNINATYPLPTDTGAAFYGSAASTPGVIFRKDYWVDVPAFNPPFVKSLSMKISTDKTKLLLQYSDTIQFVIGK